MDSSAEAAQAVASGDYEGANNAADGSEEHANNASNWRVRTTERWEPLGVCQGVRAPSVDALCRVKKGCWTVATALLWEVADWTSHPAYYSALPLNQASAAGAESCTHIAICLRKAFGSQEPDGGS